MKNLFALTILIVINLIAQIALAESKIICSNSKGNFTVRSKCKRGETRAVVKTFFPVVIQGPQGVVGPQGPVGPAGVVGVKGITGPTGLRGSFDLESCQKVTAIDTNFFSNDSQVFASATCNQATEYMLTYGFNTNANNQGIPAFVRDSNLRAVARAATLIGNSVAYGVEVTADRIVTTSAYFLTVTAVCCPRNS